MDGLDENQIKILDHQQNGLPTNKRTRTIFHFATTLDFVIIAISCFAAIVAGGFNPILAASTSHSLSVNGFNKHKGSIWSACRVLWRFSKRYSLKLDSASGCLEIHFILCVSLD